MRCRLISAQACLLVGAQGEVLAGELVCMRCAGSHMSRDLGRRSLTFFLLPPALPACPPCRVPRVRFA